MVLEKEAIIQLVFAAILVCLLILLVACIDKQVENSSKTIKPVVSHSEEVVSGQPLSEKPQNVLRSDGEVRIIPNPPIPRESIDDEGLNSSEDKAERIK